MAPLDLEDQLLHEFLKKHAQSIKRVLVFALSQFPKKESPEDPEIIFQLYALIDELN